MSVKRTMCAAVLLLAAGLVAPHAQEQPSVTGGAGGNVTAPVASAGTNADEDAILARRFAWMVNEPREARPDGMAGVRLLYDIGSARHVDQELAAQVDAIRSALSTVPLIPYERLEVVGEAVEVTIGGAAPVTEAQRAEARLRLGPLRGPIPGEGYAFDLETSGGVFRFTQTDAGRAASTAGLLDATIAAIGRRLAGIDVEATLRSQGGDRIVLTLAGAEIDEARTAIARDDGFISLHIVTGPRLARPPEAVPAGLLAVPDATDPGAVYLVDEDPVVGFAGFLSATVEVDPDMGLPVVLFRLTADAARAFAEATGANVGRALAIVVDGAVVSAPVIQAAILGGTGVISGNFDREEATALAHAISAGGMPAPVLLVEARTVDTAWPTASPVTRRGALAVELMAENGAAVLPWEIAVAAYWLGLGKTGLQRLDGDDRFTLLTMPVPDGRATALALLRKRLDGLYSIRAVRELGQLLVLEPGVGFVAG